MNTLKHKGNVSFASWLQSSHLSLGYLGVEMGLQPSLFAFKVHALYSKPDFLNLTTLGILEWIILYQSVSIGILEWIILWGDREYCKDTQ